MTLSETQMTQKFQTKLAAVESLCRTSTDGNNGTETTLADWMVEGEWESPTAQEIADEWDELSEQE